MTARCEGCGMKILPIPVRSCCGALSPGHELWCSDIPAGPERPAGGYPLATGRPIPAAGAVAA